MLPQNFFLIDKPAGITSHDVVNAVRQATGERRVGHAGTLDPFATGLLIVAVGREATRRLSLFSGMDKTYRTVIFLGAESDTHDMTGKINRLAASNKNITKEKIKECLMGFVGRQAQIPPMYSAKKIGGKKLYELARKGASVEREPVAIEIFELELLNYEWPELEVSVRVSSGTYIRALARDIGRSLGCGAYCAKLVRTGIGVYRLESALPLQEVARKKRVAAGPS